MDLVYVYQISMKSKNAKVGISRAYTESVWKKLLWLSDLETWDTIDQGKGVLVWNITDIGGICTCRDEECAPEKRDSPSGNSLPNLH